jgi:hypothetical protein
VLPAELTDGRGGEVATEEPAHIRERSLVLYKPFNTLCHRELKREERQVMFVLPYNGSGQRGLIHTEQKPLVRLYKMCDPFSHEF